MNTKTLLYILLAILLFSALGWFFFFHSSAVTQTQNQNGGGLGIASTIDKTSSVTPGNTAGGVVTPLGQAGNTDQKIFKISDGPVVNATFVQMSHPTSTIARYVLASNGHVFDLTVDSPG